MAFSLRLLVGVLDDVSKVYEGRARYLRIFKVVKAIERLYRKGKLMSESERHLKGAELIADVCSQNGAMWIKVAQYLSCRPDLLPQEYLDVFAKLQTQKSNDHSKAFAAVSELLNASWGHGWDKYFKSFNLIPAASGSIAQVYKAVVQDDTIFNGCATQVAVKIRAPGVQDLYEQDAIVLRVLANCIDPFFREFQVVKIVDEIIAATINELDFVNEKASMLQYSSLDKTHKIKTPRVVEFLSSHSVLVTEWLDADPLQVLLQDPDRALSCDQAIKQMTVGMIEDMFKHGLYHGDPHPGNILVGATEAGVDLYLIDFGLIGRLTQEQRRHYLFLLLAFVSANPVQNFPLLFKNAGFTADDPAIFIKIGQFIEDLHSDQQKNTRDQLNEIFNALRRNQVVLPQGFIGIIRVILLLSGLYQQRKLDFSSIFNQVSF